MEEIDIVASVFYLPSSSMSIVTRTGDTGETGCIGGKRISKADPRMHAIGAIDELNALLGFALAVEMEDGLRAQLLSVQHRLFRLGADLAAPEGIGGVPARPAGHSGGPRIEAEHAAELERWIGDLETRLPPLTAFIVPGGTEAGARLHHARAVCRRAERWVVALAEREPVRREIVVFLNRLGDYLFLAARAVNREGEREETRVEYGK